MAKVKLENSRIAIIGGGHMGLALAKGLIQGGKINPSQLWVADPTLSKIVHLKKYNIKVTTSNCLAVSNADTIFVVVKPLVVKAVMEEIKELVKHKLVVCTAAALSVKKLKAMTSQEQKIVRIMPNLPVAYGKGVIGFFSEELVAPQEKTRLIKILSSLGTVVKLKSEKELDVITLISACGPAIVSNFIEMVVDYARRNKINKKIASKVVIQTFIGTLVYLTESGISPPEFIKSVATRGGITEAILKNLNREFFVRAMESGRIKIENISKLNE